MDHQREYPNAAPAVNVEMGHPPAMYPSLPTTHGQAMNQQHLGTHGQAMYPPLPTTHGQAMYPPLPTTHGQAMNQQQLGAHGPNNWVGNNANALLVVAATLITTLTYLVGTNIPGGYWQETKLQDGKLQYRAGDPIMRDLHRPRYWVFRAASWVGFGSSMVMTLSLLVGMKVTSRHVRWSFVLVYSSLVLTFIVSQTRTHLSLDILVWAAVLIFLWLTISVREEHRTRIIQALCCSHHN